MTRRQKKIKAKPTAPPTSAQPAGPAIDQGSMQVNYVLRNMRLDDGRWYVALVAIPDLDTDKFILYKG
jgi:hypothetical protein